ADGKTAASAATRDGGEGRQVGEVKLWDAATGRELVTLEGRLGPVLSLALSADGKSLALVDQGEPDGGAPRATVRVFDLPAGRERFDRSVAARPFLSVAFRGETLFLLGGEETTALLWEVVPPKRGGFSSVGRASSRARPGRAAPPRIDEATAGQAPLRMRQSAPAASATRR